MSHNMLLMNYETVKNFTDYLIYKDGRVFSIKSDKFLSPIKCWSYMAYALMNKGIRKTYYIHRLLAEHFIPNSKNKLCVNHINGNKLDNRIENLEWVTKGENIAHGKILIHSGVRRTWTTNSLKYINNLYNFDSVESLLNFLNQYTGQKTSNFIINKHVETN